MSGGFPSNGVLRPHIRDIRAETQRLRSAFGGDPDIADGCTSDMMYRQRFNLTTEQINLIKADTAPRCGPQNFEIARGVYYRSLLKPNKLYAFMSLQIRPRCFYIADSKSVAGKDAPLDGEAVGRFISVAWFESESALEDGVRIYPVNKGSANLDFQTCTVAELLRAAGHFEAHLEGETAREVELGYEEKFLDFDLRVFPNATRTAGEVLWESYWTFALHESENVESFFLMKSMQAH